MIKREVIQLCKTLEAPTEDKVYVYKPDHLKLNRWIAESVAEVANHADMSKMDPEMALKTTISALSITDVEDNKHIFYIFDRTTPSHHRRLDRGMRYDLVNNTEIKFWLLDLGVKPSQEVSKVASNHPFCKYFQISKPTSHFFEELIHVKD